MLIFITKRRYNDIMCTKININRIKELDSEGLYANVHELVQLMRKGEKLQVIEDNDGRSLVCGRLDTISELAQNAIIKEVEGDDIRAILLQTHVLRLYG